jgi:energy-coupling factor transporter ATP-binding protein EcfA2
MLSHILSPRPDVLSGRIQGVIDPDRIEDPKKKSLEAKPLDFAGATYVSTDIRRMVKTLHQRLNHSAADVGTILFEGPKGQGKSHLITLAFHLVKHHSELTPWLAENKLELTVPASVVVILRKFTDFPLESLWQVIGDELGVKFPADRPPSLSEFRAALTGRKLVLLFDELESGIRAIADDARRQQNINFLQMVSEDSLREDSNVVLIASVYDGGIEPGLTLKRVKPTEIRFADAGDRLRIIYHRLFTKSPEAASAEIDTVIKSYVNTWQRFGIPASTAYADRLRETYPFTPELLEVVFQRIPNRGGFQGTRGALGFLATLVRQRSAQTNLLTLSDVALADAEIRTWLADLEPAQNLISCAEANLRELAKLPLADRIASASLIASLAPSARYPGLNEEELARQVIDPASDYNQFSQTLGGFVQYASYFHKRDQSLFFDTKENAHAKVELRSLSVQESEAWDRVAQWWRSEIFQESDAIILQEIDLARARLDALQTDGLRFVISPRRLTPEERHALYFGFKRRNTVLLLEPRDDKTNLRTHKDILAWARKAIAADALATASVGDAGRIAEFNKIAADQKRAVLDAIKKVNFAYLQVHRAGATPGENEFTLEPVQPLTKTGVLEHLTRNLYPPAYLAEHIQNRAAELLGRKVATIETEYRNTLSFPVIVHANGFDSAIRQLVIDAVFNLAHPSGTQHAGETPQLSAQELMDSSLATPSARPAISPTGKSQPAAAKSLAGITGNQGQNSGQDSSGGNDALPFGSTQEQVSTVSCPSRQELRQQIAAKLDGLAGRTVIRVRIGLLWDDRTIEMSTLPAFLRGSLTGTGAFSGEVILNFSGSFNKAAVEEMIERLPDFSPGSAKVTLTLDS